jgi:CubicO group peptidase (beta-lactamase class C family)
LANIDSTYFTVGTQFKYSNSGFCILEQIVEKVSGIKYVDFIQQKIFNELGLNNSTVFEAGKIIANRAMGYARDENGDIVARDQSLTSADKGDGCVYTSLYDYQIWINAIKNNTFVNLKNELQLINKKIELSDNGIYGLGWFHAFDSKNNLELYHTGSSCGFSNVVKIIPQFGFSIFYFSNLADNHGVYYEIEILLKKYQIDPTENDFRKILELTN